MQRDLLWPKPSDDDDHGFLDRFEYCETRIVIGLTRIVDVCED